MKNKVIYSQFVKEDLKQIADWYKEINPNLKLRFLQDFRERIKFLQEHPFSAEIKYDDIRIAFLKKFPVGIHYNFNEFFHEVQILAVFHTSRDPDNWEGRLKNPPFSE